MKPLFISSKFDQENQVYKNFWLKDHVWIKLYSRPSRLLFAHPGPKGDLKSPKKKWQRGWWQRSDFLRYQRSEVPLPHPADPRTKVSIGPSWDPELGGVTYGLSTGSVPPVRRQSETRYKVFVKYLPEPLVFHSQCPRSIINERVKVLACKTVNYLDFDFSKTDTFHWSSLSQT